MINTYGFICHLFNMKINIFSDRGSHKKVFLQYNNDLFLCWSSKFTDQNISNNSKKSAIKITDIICKQKGDLIYQIFIYTKTFVHASNVGKLDWNECANNVSAFDNNVLRERLYANWSVTECIKTLLLFWLSATCRILIWKISSRNV